MRDSDGQDTRKREGAVSVNGCVWSPSRSTDVDSHAAGGGGGVESTNVEERPERQRSVATHRHGERRVR